MALAVCAGAVRAGEEPVLRGPRTVALGSVVRFHAVGLRPGSMLAVVLTPADRASCCAIRIPSSFPVSQGGTATLTFRMPRYYLNCPAWHKCRKIRWTARERVVVSVFGYLQQVTTTTLVAQ